MTAHLADRTRQQEERPIGQRDGEQQGSNRDQQRQRRHGFVGVPADLFAERGDDHDGDSDERNGTNHAPTTFFGSGSSLDLAGSTSRRAFDAANHVHPSTQAPATAPAAIDDHM